MREKLKWVAVAAFLSLIVLYISVSLYRTSEIKPAAKVTVRIKDGESVLEINKDLKSAGVFLNYELPSNVEGYLYPDTYEFFVPSGKEVVLQKFLDNFNSKAAPLFTGDYNLKDVLTVASLIEKEVPKNGDDREKVSGIIWKRLQGKMPLQIDATVCYAKQLRLDDYTGCYPLKSSDFADSSLYNTYRHTGLPPGPIGNPESDAIYSALHPVSSPYWFFLSDPKTGKTIFAKTLDEQTRNIAKYLE